MMFADCIMLKGRGGEQRQLKIRTKLMKDIDRGLIISKDKREVMVVGKLS